jgi:cobyrinic acid a,c-diamide synthase
MRCFAARRAGRGDLASSRATRACTTAWRWTAATATRRWPNAGLPVLLVIDARGMTRGIAPLILGYQAFDRDIRIGGVILNRVGGARHESKLRAVIEHYTDVPVLGAVPRIRAWRSSSATSA